MAHGFHFKWLKWLLKIKATLLLADHAHKQKSLKKRQEWTVTNKKETPLLSLRSYHCHRLQTQPWSRCTWTPFRVCAEFSMLRSHQENLELNLLHMFTKLSLGTSIMILVLSGNRRGQRHSDVKKDTLAVRRQVTHLANILCSIFPPIAWSSVFLLKVSYHFWQMD